MESTVKIDALSDLVRSSGHISLLFSHDDELRAFALREGDSWVVGRSEPAGIVFQHPALSALHARFSLCEGRVLVEDLQSKNGSFLNGSRISKATIGEGDVVRIGGIDVRVSGRLLTSEAHRTLSHATYSELLTDEVTRARLCARSVAVAAVRHPDDASVRAVLRQALGPLDKVCDYAPSVSLLLLPEQDASSSRAWCERVMLEARAQLRVGLAVYPTVAGSAAELISLALDACHDAGSTGLRIVAVSGPKGPVSAPIVASACTKRLYDLIARAARTTLPVLVQGETGTGKELAARAVHDLSPRRKAPFRTLNCGAIPAQLLESVLFGHERGAFTGANRQTQGVFEQAQGGTVFLDEIGELPLAAQVALLRVLEQRKVVRVGGSKDIVVDARVVAATHRDLEAMVRAKTFRQDLLFRLDALTLHVPPLRERKEEILPLAELFLARARAQWHVSAQRLSEDARDALLTYAYPGNVRQLKNVIERAAVVCSTDEVQLEDLPAQLLYQAPVEGDTFVVGQSADESLTHKVRAFEVGLIRQALRKTRGNQSQAARILGVARRTLAYKVHAFGLLDDVSAEAE